MDIFINILIFLHIIGLVLGMGSGMAMSRIGPIMAEADGSQRGVLFKLGALLSANGHIGLLILWISGPLVIWLKYGALSGFGAWFWAKMVFVVVLSAAIGIGGAAFRRARGGDMSAMKRAKAAGMVSGLAALAAVFCAVFAFN